MARSNIVPRVSLLLTKKRDRENEVEPEVVIILGAGGIAVFILIHPTRFQESLVVCDVWNVSTDQGIEKVAKTNW